MSKQSKTCGSLKFGELKNLLTQEISKKIPW